MARQKQITVAAVWAGRVGLAALFAYAGGLKALDPAEFAAAIDRYRLLPYPAVAVVALWLPWIEILGALAVFWPRMRAGALLLLGLCSVAFVGVTTSAIVRGIDIECGCFGEHSGGSSLMVAALRAAALVILCAGLLRHEAASAVPTQPSPSG